MMKKTVVIGLIFFLLSFSIAPQIEVEARNFSVSAEAAIMMEQESGRILYAKNDQTSLRIASITKIMTALLAIESGKMQEQVKISTNAEGTEGSSIYLRAGESMLLEDLVYGLMLRSGNDAAVAIAEHVGGSLEGFVYLMNEKARELGMNQTQFQNPHGLDDHEDHYSSAYDMALLTRYAMESPLYQEISSAKTHRVDGDQIRVWHNKNRLLTELYEYSTGGKTGFTKRARRTLVSTASKDDLDLIVVTLNAPSDWHDHMNLFNWAFDSFSLETLVEEGMFKDIKDEFYKDHVFSPYTFEYPLLGSEKEMVQQKITLYRPPTEEERDQYVPPHPVGKVDITLSGEKIGQVPLYYHPPEVVEKQGFWSRFLSIFSLTLGVRGID
ncbi:D-alanyl-D-alanine carboxypeptidase family protein [Alkalihalophilus marmarensis]|uniref:D-alanyl-D-alanine carboxypeptidase family protein n=1 Tax=Alkalihalophilus marmarensis TaxID=521377 RepID=UPI002E1AF5F0|nr:D-alanyl-D-alanine carboxypeptidase [Alkalihalophilus marmarensis]